MATANDTTMTNTWDAELIALRDEIYAEHGSPQFTIQDAAQCAIGQLRGLQEYAAAWDAQAAPYQSPDPGTPQARKAQYYLANGLRTTRIRGGHLVPSGSRCAVVHFVSDTGHCSCEASQHGRSCWHVEAVRQYQTMGRAA